MVRSSDNKLDWNAGEMEMKSEELCWICLDESTGSQGLCQPCKCPRRVHPQCMARWQLQQAGRMEETRCRFCSSPLSDWKASLTPEALKPEVENMKPIMVVYFDGQIHRIPVSKGSDGLKEFTERIRSLYNLPDGMDLTLTFGCKEPSSGQQLRLQGAGAFDAAVHCASIAAADRRRRQCHAPGSNASCDMSQDPGEDLTEMLERMGAKTDRSLTRNNNQVVRAVEVPNPSHSVHYNEARQQVAPLHGAVNQAHALTNPLAMTEDTEAEAEELPTGWRSLFKPRQPATESSGRSVRRQTADPAQQAHVNNRQRQAMEEDEFSECYAVTRSSSSIDPTPPLLPGATNLWYNNAFSPSSSDEEMSSTDTLVVPTLVHNAMPQDLTPPLRQESVLSRLRRTATRTQRAPQSATVLPSQPSASASVLSSSPVSKKPTNVWESETVVPEVFSRTQLNRVLRLLGIKPPSQFAVGSSLCLND